jgi:hypothetical protein
MSNEAMSGAGMSRKYLFKALTAALTLALVASSCADKDEAVNEAVAALEEAADALAVAQVAREEAESVAAAAVAEAQAAAAAAAQAVADATAAAALAETGDAAAQAAAQAEADAAALAAELAEAAAAYAQEQADIAEAEAEAAALLAEAQAAAQAEEDEEETEEEEEESGPSFGNLQPGVISPILPALTLPPVISIPPVLLTCMGDEAPTQDYDGPIWEAHIDGDANGDHVSVAYGNDTGRWYLRVDSSYHGVTFWRDLGPDAGEVNFSIGHITDINVNDRAEIWVSSFDASGPHAPFAHVMYLLHGCALTPVGSNITGSEDVLTVFLGQAVTGEAFYVSCSTFEGEPLFTYSEDYPIGPGLWAYRPLSFRLYGATLNLVLDEALEGGVGASPVSITEMNCP